jgi:hypothetical protein
MQIKVLPFFALLILVMMSLYIVFNPSYQKSIEAKYYYETGNYTDALVLANEAFNLDIYNRMASTVKAQTLIALKYFSYNNDAKSYMNQLNALANHTILSDADKAKIRIICEIMIGRYKKLSSSIITDEALVKQSATYYQNFEKLLEKVSS